MAPRDVARFVGAPRRIREPIIVLGSGRSGTTLLAETLSLHPDVAYWGEPRPIWMHGNAYRRDQLLRAEHLTPRIARFIDRRFSDFLASSGRSRFLEKTPSNCLRIDFIHALYPDAKFVNIVRDGRATVRSMLEIRKKPPNPGLMGVRLRETPLLDWPAYLPMFLRTVWRTSVLGKPGILWGAAPPGWREWAALPPEIVAARQWKALVGWSLRDGRALPASQYLELRFEDLVAEPERRLREVLAFTELREAPGFVEEALRRVDRGRVRDWATTLTAEQEEEVARELEPLLSELGYTGGPGGGSEREVADGR